MARISFDFRQQKNRQQKNDRGDGKNCEICGLGGLGLGAIDPGRQRRRESGMTAFLPPPFYFLPQDFGSSLDRGLPQGFACSDLIHARRPAEFGFCLLPGRSDAWRNAAIASETYWLHARAGGFDHWQPGARGSADGRHRILEPGAAQQSAARSRGPARRGFCPGSNDQHRPAAGGLLPSRLWGIVG